MRGYNLSAQTGAVDPYRVPLWWKTPGRPRQAHAGPSRSSSWSGTTGAASSRGPLRSRIPRWLEKLVIVNAPHPAFSTRDPATTRRNRKPALHAHVPEPEAETTLSANNYAMLVNVLEPADLKQGISPKPTDGVPRSMVAARRVDGRAQLLPRGTGRPAGRRRGAAGRSATAPARMIVRVPTLVIWGEKDTALLPAISSAWSSSSRISP